MKRRRVEEPEPKVVPHDSLQYFEIEKYISYKKYFKARGGWDSRYH